MQSRVFYCPGNSVKYPKKWGINFRKPERPAQLGALFLLLLLSANETADDQQGKQKKEILTLVKILYSLFVYFLCLPKENEPKEKAADHLVRLRWTVRSLCPVFKGAAQNNRVLRNSRSLYPLAGCSGSPRAVPVIFHCSAT